MVELLTICTGNVCRSPLAEMVLRSTLAPLGVQVHSAGTQPSVGQRMTEEAMLLVERHGGSPSDAAEHRARVLTEGMLASPDLIITMTRAHRHHVVDLAPQRIRTTFTAREFERLSRLASDDELRSAADGATSPGDRLALAVARVGSMRGMAEPPAHPGDDDVVDPYRRSWQDYELCAAQLIPAINEVTRVARVALA